MIDLLIVLRPLSTWFNSDAFVSWESIEENLVYLHRLIDLVHSAISLKHAKLHFCPIITYFLSGWRKTEKTSNTTQKWHLNSLIFHNHSLLSGSAPFSSPFWKTKGVHFLGDIFYGNGLRYFNELQVTFNLPASSFFLYLQLRSSMKAYDTPWNTPLAYYPQNT